MSSRHGRRSVTVPVLYRILQAWNTLLPFDRAFESVQGDSFLAMYAVIRAYIDEGGLPPTLQIRG